MIRNIAIVECFNHEYYIRGKLQEYSKHYKIKFQGHKGFEETFRKKFPEYKFYKNSLENEVEPNSYDCWCQAMTDFLLGEGFEPFKLDHQAGLHYFVLKN